MWKLDRVTGVSERRQRGREERRGASGLGWYSDWKMTSKDEKQERVGRGRATCGRLLVLMRRRGNKEQARNTGPCDTTLSLCVFRSHGRHRKVQVNEMNRLDNEHMPSYEAEGKTSDLRRRGEMTGGMSTYQGWRARGCMALS